jgi:hypothetical protein
MKHLRWISRFVGIVVFSFSLVFSALSFVGGQAIDVISQAIYQTTGLKSQALQQAEDLRRLRGDLDESRVARRELGEELAESQAELASSRKLRSELGEELVESRTIEAGLRDRVSELDEVISVRNNQIADLNTTLRTERLAREAAEDVVVDMEIAERQLRRQLDDATAMTRLAQRNALATTIDTAEGSLSIRDAMRRNTTQIADRTEKIARRGVSGMAAEAVPYLGTAAIVGLTALDIKDLCEMALSSRQMYYSIFPEETPGEEDPTVCGLNVPTRSELWTMAKSAPGQAFAATKDALPELEDIQEIDGSDFWNFGLSAVEWSAETYESGKALADLSLRSLTDFYRDWNR